MSRVLIPVAVLKGETVVPGLVEFLSTADVTLLGYHVVPDQTSTDQARDQFGEQAQSVLAEITEQFEGAGVNVDHRLVFTHDRKQTVQRIAAETHAGAVATPGVADTVERLLVSLTGDVDVDRILVFVTELVGDRDVTVTLFVAGTETEAVRTRLEESADQLSTAGVEAETRVGGGSPFAALRDAVPGHDVVVLGERAPSLSSVLFGEEADRIAATSVSPVLLVRSDPDAGD